MKGWTDRQVYGQMDRLADRQQAPGCWWRKGGWTDKWMNVDRNLDCIESRIMN